MDGFRRNLNLKIFQQFPNFKSKMCILSLYQLPLISGVIIFLYFSILKNTVKGTRGWYICELITLFLDDLLMVEISTHFYVQMFLTIGRHTVNPTYEYTPKKPAYIAHVWK